MKRLVILGAMAAVIPLPAHHSFQAEYDGKDKLVLKGKVMKVTPENPHGWLSLNVTNDKGRVINWQLELPPPNFISRNGFTPDVYRELEKNNEEVTIEAYAAKDGSKHAWAATLKRADGSGFQLGGLIPQPYNVPPKDDRKVNTTRTPAGK
jgi:hypothetical protein